MVIFKHTNLLDSTAEILVNAVNCVGVMGKGLALQFKQKYPDMFEAYRRDCLAKKVKIGHIGIYPIENGSRYVFNFPTKDHWKFPAKYAWVNAGIKDLVSILKITHRNSIAIPALGCGYGGLSWEKVKDILVTNLTPLDYLRIEVYPPRE